MRDEARSNPDNYGHILPTLESLIELEDQELPLDAEAQSERVFIHAERAYAHQILQINYSTYDTRREQDILNPNTGRRDIMCLRREYDPAGRGSASHQFCYARILGIYHVNVIFLGNGYLDRRPRRFDVLWVRWYTELDDLQPWSAWQLDRLKFPKLSEGDNVGFLDPSHVVRACHIIPRFSTGLVHSEGSLTSSFSYYPFAHQTGLGLLIVIW